jgi:hypothetical protein
VVREGTEIREFAHYTIQIDMLFFIAVKTTTKELCPT